MFVNFTNHPSAKWSGSQLNAAVQYAEIRDVPFPAVPPQASEAYVASLAEEYTKTILSLKPKAVLCQGEFSLCFAVTAALITNGVDVLCACSERKVTEITLPSGATEKRIEFEFAGFRKYAMTIKSTRT
ncbi:hypothetical protein FACS1894105_00450 [Clostridia bacterium]|nr:hypothetical protein FACS1894105_00450 [Clostridia bacterium]